MDLGVVREEEFVRTVHDFRGCKDEKIKMGEVGKEGGEGMSE